MVKGCMAPNWHTIENTRALESLDLEHGQEMDGFTKIIGVTKKPLPSHGLSAVWALNRSDMLQPKHWSSNTQKTLGLGVHLRPMAHSHRSFWFFLRHSASCLFQSLEHHWQVLCVTVIVGVFPCFSRSPRAFWVAFLRAERNSTTKKRGLSKLQIFWTQRLTLLCHKTAASGPHTVHISSSLSNFRSRPTKLPGFQHISTTNSNYQH